MNDQLDRLRAPDMFVCRLHDRREFEAAWASATDRTAYEELLQRAYAEVDRWWLPAVCQACGVAVGLLADKQYGWPRRVNFRERLACPRCQLNTRQRLMAHLVRRVVGAGGGSPRVYLYEQVTPFFQWARASLPANVIGSEYLGHGLPGGTVINGIRHEDALALSFEDASLDLVVSQDVLEHVPEIEPAISESARVLRPGGHFYFSVPFNVSADVTIQRAVVSGGEVVSLMEPQFHGNPLAAEGSLVFYDHGWDLLDRLRASGFADVCMLGVWSALYGYLGGGLLTVFTARRV